MEGFLLSVFIFVPIFFMIVLALAFAYGLLREAYFRAGPTPNPPK